MSKNKGFSRVMALVLLICMVVSFAPAAYADVDEAPAVQEETVVEESTVKKPVSEEEAPVEEKDAETPEQPAVPSGSNSIKELFKFHCTADDTHADQTYNWFGSYVKYNNDMAYDAARGVWTATANITNVQTLLSTGVKAPNKVWGKTHYHTDADGNTVRTATIKLVWDANATGQNASGTETTGLWLPDGGVQTVDVWCATAPAAPTIAGSFTRSAGSTVAIRIQDSAYDIPKYAKSYSKVTYFRYLKEGTYKFTPVTKDENGDYWCDLIIDPTSYIDEFNTANKADPAFRLDPNKPLSNFTYKMKYTGSKTDFKTDGSGWSMQSSSYDKTIGETAKTGKVAYVSQYYTVTYSDGANGTVFADQSYTVRLGKATPAFDGTPEREGYVFKGWAPTVAETVTGNVTYVAQWNALYTVTYTDGVDGEELFADQSTTVEAGSKTPAFPRTPERAGYTFSGWAPEVAETVTKDVTYTAQWTANDYTLSRDSNGGDELADVTVTMGQPYGDAIVASPRAGYTEDGWFLIVDDTVRGIEIKADTEVAMPDNHRIFLKRSIAPVTVTVSEDITKDYDGEEIALTASTEEYTGLRYAYQWYKDGEVLAGKNDKTLTLDGNVADSGVYTVKLTVTNAQDSGVITENDAVSTEAEVKVVVNKINNALTYNYNGADEKDSTVETTESTVTVDADKEITRKGYDFLGWNTKADGTGDSYKSGDELTFADNGNGGEAVTLYAQWKGREYKLTFKIKEDPDFKEDVKLNFTSKTVVYGEKVGQFPYATRKDHILVWYDKDGKRVNSETVYLVEGDSTYTGVWTEYKPVVATGDSSNIALYAAAMFASIACIGAGVILLRRKREE